MNIHQSKPYGSLPHIVGRFDISLTEVMHYLYLPVSIDCDPRLPPRLALPTNIECCRQMIHAALRSTSRSYRYVYLTARKGWASPDNPLNRPGWHCDGFGTDDMNFIWWVGPGTRIAAQDFHEISDDHVRSLEQFEEQVDLNSLVTYPEQTLIALDPFCVHSTPLIKAPGCWRQFVKISLSDNRYNLENNSHNYLLNYYWALHSREDLRNDPHQAQADFVKENR